MPVETHSPMPSEKESASLLRRLKFSGDSRLFFDRLISVPLTSAVLPARWSETLHRIPDRSAVIAFDILESIRMRGLVPSFAEARKAILKTSSLIPQHPRYRGFWYDPGKHSMIGMHVGVDLIRSKGRYYVLEINLDVGIKPERRTVSGTRFDPMIPGILETAKGHGFERVILYRRHFRETFIDQFKEAGREAGVEVTAVGFAHWGTPAAKRLVALPEVLSERTMVVVFSSRHTPMDYYVHDKLCGSIWFEENQLNESPSALKVSWVPTYEKLIVPPLDPESRWPNLVAKLADWDKARFVLMAKVRNESEAIEALGLKDPAGMPGEFKLGLYERLVNFMTRRGKVIYQPFIPADLDPEGRPRKFRLHLLVSPLETKFLSVTAVASHQKPVEAYSFGLIKDRDLPVFSHSRGTGKLAGIEPEVENEVREIAGSIGKILDHALKKKFQTGP